MNNLVTPSILSAQVSFFENCYQTDGPKNGTFLQIVVSKKLATRYAPLLASIRAESDKEERSKLKIKLPCFTPSGTFSHRSAAGLVKHSGLVQFDIDPKQNPWLTALNAPAVRDDIANFNYVAYCALSASGAGVWGVVPIADPDQHAAHYKALISDFEGWGVNIDTSCQNVDRLRFWSYDPAAYFNPNAVLYSKIDVPPAPCPVHTWTPQENGSLARRAAQYLMGTGAAVAYCYDDYQRITAACQYEFGDDGEAIAWDILENSPAFLVSNFRKHFVAHWRSFKRWGGDVCTGGTLVHFAKQAGFEPHHYAPPQAHRSTQPTPPALPPGFERRTFKSQFTGESYELVINADGYPAAWDLPDSQQAALSQMIRASPTVTELIARFDLKPCF